MPKQEKDIPQGAIRSMNSGRLAKTAVDRLVDSDDDGNWPYRFVVRGREYIMVPDGPMTFDGEGTWALFRVWNDRGKMTDVKVRAADKVTLVSTYSNASNKEYRIENPKAQSILL